ncbi:polysaccharide deacetylase family protein [Paenibacillus sp. CMAA1364]
MKEIQSIQRKRRNKIRLRLMVIVLIMLTSAFLIGFIIGESYADSGKNIEQNITYGVEAPTITIPDNIETETETDSEPTTVETSVKEVYLTFDDGPSKLTNQFLDILHEQDVKATFFMQGANLKKEHLQKSVKRAIAEGHYIGGHSMTHNFKTLYKDNQLVPEMKATLALIEEITGTKPNLVRPPFGSAPGMNSEKIRNQLVDVGIHVWDWTIDSNDWALKDNPSQIVENIKKGTKKDREVVLMHEKPQTLAALPEIISFYKKQGYTFVVYDETNHFALNFQNDMRL